MSESDGVWMRSYTQMGVTVEGDIVFVEAKARVSDLDRQPTFVAMLESAVRKDFAARYPSASVTDAQWGANWYMPTDQNEEV